jgi:hypothetical protein
MKCQSRPSGRPSQTSAVTDSVAPVVVADATSTCPIVARYGPAARAQLGSRAGLTTAIVAKRADRALQDRRIAQVWLPGQLGQAAENLAGGVHPEVVACRLVDIARTVLKREVPE